MHADSAAYPRLFALKLNLHGFYTQPTRFRIQSIACCVSLCSPHTSSSCPGIIEVSHLSSSLRTFRRFVYGSPPPPVPRIPQPASRRRTLYHETFYPRHTLPALTVIYALCLLKQAWSLSCSPMLSASTSCLVSIHAPSSSNCKCCT